MPRSIMLWDGVGLGLDDITPSNFITCTVMDGPLVLLDGRAIHNSDSNYTYMVALGGNSTI